MTSSTLDRITALIGLPATIGLTRVFGGQRVWVPSAAPSPSHPLTQAVGGDAVELLCAEFGNAKLEVPSARAALIAARNEAIIAGYLAGRGIRELHRAHKLSPRMIRKILDAGGVVRPDQGK